MSDHLADIRRAIRSTPEFRRLAQSFPSDRSISGVRGSLSSFLIGELFLEKPCSFLVVAPNRQTAEYLRDDLSVWYGEDRVAFFPRTEKITKVESFRASSDEFRMDALEKLLGGDHCMVVAELPAMWDPIMDRDRFQDRTLSLSTQGEYGFQQVVRHLAESGYSKEAAVTQPLEMSVRGGILDVFPLGAENPFRLEFFGDTLESIRSFSVSTQRSVEKLSQVKIPPGMSTGQDGRENGSLLRDYLPEDTVVYWESFEDMESDAGPDEPSPAELAAELSGRYPQIISRRLSTDQTGTDIEFHATAQDAMHGDLEVFRSQLSGELSRGMEAYIVCENAEQVYRLKKFLEPHDHQHIFSHELSQGFTFPPAKLVVYTDHQIYSRFKSRRTFQKFAHQEIPKMVDHLQLGDFLVHQDYGIGVFRGLQKVRQRSGEYECIVIEYQDGDKVYVPLQKFHRVQKYQGTEGTQPQIHKLGSTKWETAKRKSREAAEEVAQDLVELYGTRHTIEGHSFEEDSDIQLEMESAFLYDETEDQIQATIEVKEDMESAFPMDRLLIGDVGFGKTEVAIRAAFKAVLDSKQVAVLVPTTILAEQHYETFSQRLQRLPVRMASLSRFRTKSEQKEILHGLSSGDLDIVIGTHRLLSKDIQFRDLGLVIVDEEHRFGVKHKEKLKQMTAHVDVLSMTATPIPRTLQLSLSGARDLSKIETPPKERLPIYTEIGNFDDDFVREVIQREIARGGQVYFVHNRIQNIGHIHQHLAALLPDLRFAVAHGQMKAAQLEKVMYDFLHRKYDVLISTAIIESGIDIPNVNTILINRADQMGLAQLYQLRGRVGRANRRAYAYLLVPSVKTMTGEARSRLQTLKSFTHLGAGYQIAMKDLAMRGAGNLLGLKQSGFINTVGFDLYIDMINKAVQEKQIQHGIRTIASREVADAEILTAFDTYIPEEYVSNADHRIDLYRRLSGATTSEEIEDLSEELVDRFGPLPDEAENLIQAMSLRVLCNDLGIDRLSVRKERIKGRFIGDEKMQGLINFDQVVPNMLDLSRDAFIPKFIPDDQLRFQLKFRTPRNQLQELKYFLMQLLEAVKFTPSE